MRSDYGGRVGFCGQDGEPESRVRAVQPPEANYERGMIPILRPFSSHALYQAHLSAPVSRQETEGMLLMENHLKKLVT